MDSMLDMFHLSNQSLAGPQLEAPGLGSWTPVWLTLPETLLLGMMGSMLLGMMGSTHVKPPDLCAGPPSLPTGQGQLCKLTMSSNDLKVSKQLQGGSPYNFTHKLTHLYKPLQLSVSQAVLGGGDHL